MTEQITLEEALKLVTFHQSADGAWYVQDVNTDVLGSVEGSIFGDIRYSVFGTVYGDVSTVKNHLFGGVGGNVVGTVEGNVGAVGGHVWDYVGKRVWGTIEGRKWQFVETPKEKLQRMIAEGVSKAELQEAFNQLEDNNG